MPRFHALLTVTRSTHDAGDEHDREPAEEHETANLGRRKAGGGERPRDREPHRDRKREESIFDEETDEFGSDAA